MQDNLTLLGIRAANTIPLCLMYTDDLSQRFVGFIQLCMERRAVPSTEFLYRLLLNLILSHEECTQEYTENIDALWHSMRPFDYATILEKMEELQS